VKDSSLRARIGRVYDLLHLALWSLLIAFLLFFALIVLPKVPARQARQQAMRMLQNEAEYDAYCRGWGLMPGTRLYAQCLTDLAQFRRSVETQFVENNGPM
jgi:hypothetical protein